MGSVMSSPMPQLCDVTVVHHSWVVVMVTVKPT